MLRMEFSETEHSRTLKIDPACASVIAALKDDPFYRSICGEHLGDNATCRDILMRYFAYSIQEGKENGRCCHPENLVLGVAVWLLPQPSDLRRQASRRKRRFLKMTLDATGCANYYRIVDFMSNKSLALVGPGAWYLSIVAVDPASQGHGLGRQLLEPTLAEADRVFATCYLETFSARNISFYERLGFSTKTRFTEPTTNADYALMVRQPGVSVEERTL